MWFRFLARTDERMNERMNRRRCSKMSSRTWKFVSLLKPCLEEFFSLFKDALEEHSTGYISFNNSFRQSSSRFHLRRGHHTTPWLQTCQPSSQQKNSLCWRSHHLLLLLPEFDISVSKLLGFETFWFFLMVSVSVSENFGIEKSIGIGFGKIWYRKKYRYRFRKFLVSKKVSVSENLVSVLKIFGIEKNIGFKKFGIQKYRILKIFLKKSSSVIQDFWRWSEEANTLNCTLQELPGKQ